jgi:hypothetical protein
MDTYAATDVFTPSTVARLTFVERRRITERVVDALQTPGRQLVVFGRSGCGKTTLVDNKLRQLYERHVTSRCMRGTKVDDLIVDAFDQLAPYFIESRKETRSRKSGLTLGTVCAQIKAELAASRDAGTEAVSKRALPPQLNVRFLAELLGEANACWVLEDFHKVEGAEKARIAQLMKVFMDLAVDYPMVKIVANGAVATGRQVVQADAEMWNRIAEIEVPLMSGDEVEEIVAKGERLLDVRFPDEIKASIKHYSNGLAAVAHQLCLNLCFERGVVETQAETLTFTNEDFARALERWLADAADTLRSHYDAAVRVRRAPKFQYCRIVLQALARLPQDGGGWGELYEAIRAEQPAFPKRSLTRYLTQLCSAEKGELLAQDPVSGRYSFASPLMHAYVRARAVASDAELLGSFNGYLVGEAAPAGASLDVVPSADS